VKITETERKYRTNLRELTNAVSFALAQLDLAMNLPSGPLKGQIIAGITNKLDMANDLALHFGLDKTMRSIQKRKEEYDKIGTAVSREW
jgi:hypothetical protein